MFDKITGLYGELHGEGKGDIIWLGSCASGKVFLAREFEGVPT